MTKKGTISKEHFIFQPLICRGYSLVFGPGKSFFGRPLLSLVHGGETFNGGSWGKLGIHVKTVERNFV